MQGAVSRLQKEYVRLLRNPVEGIEAKPLENDILTWHYVFRGPKDTPYAEGIYHGKITFPPTYPFAPPGIHIMTPNGCFDINTKVCLSMSDYHPETWNPLWSVSSILTGLVSFMAEPRPTVLSSTTSERSKKNLALDSHRFNLQNPLFRQLFPEWANECTERAERIAATPPNVSDMSVGDEAQQSNQRTRFKYISILVILCAILYAVSRKFKA